MPRSFPTADRYSGSLQNPHLCFIGDPGLQSATFAQTKIGLPRLLSGSFACVAHATERDGRGYAVRLFVREPPDSGRMRAISAFLAGPQVAAEAESYFAGFVYQESGVRVDNETYPYVKMEWVSGVSLRAFVRAALARQDSAALEQLAVEWVRLIQTCYHTLQLAHGDLQSGNILIRPDGIPCLIDYDGIYLPKFAGESSPLLGQPDYQHPRRQATDFDEHLDIFSALLIWCALRALVYRPTLWDSYDNGGDNLLFQVSDLLAPRQSPLFAELRTIGEEERIREIAGVLADWCEQGSHYPIPPSARALFEAVFPPATPPRPDLPAVVLPTILPVLPPRWVAPPPVTPLPDQAGVRAGAVPPSLADFLAGVPVAPGVVAEGS